ncbi:MAG: hypothetical protein AB8B55_13055 [Mariniblastus sp.]
MILRFPNLDALQLAMTSGLVPEQVWIASAQAAFDEDNSVVVKSDKKLTRTQLAKLKQVGVESIRKSPVALDLSVCCWLQILPLVQHKPSEIKELSDSTTVLFHLPGQTATKEGNNDSNSELPNIVSEILRLGNDRQSFRVLDSNGKQPYLNHAAPNKGANGQPASLLRVIGPPYYSMLRALEVGTGTGTVNGATNEALKNGQSDSQKNQPSITAFIETHPRVWVQYGFAHPLGARVTPPPGKWLLLRPGHSWMFIDEAPFRDIYESLEFGLPNLETGWEDKPLEKKIDVALNLTRGSTGEMAELWVLRKNAIAQMEKLVLESDDGLLSRLAFAVAETKGEEPAVIVRVRPSKKQPPVLVLDGIAYRSYLKIPNLFLPVGMRLHPPLRRDAVTKLLASKSQEVVWLEPDENTESTGQLNQAFAPNSVPDSAFRPVVDWVKYVLDHELESLGAWVESHQFDFEGFVCSEDKKAKPKPKPKDAPQPIGKAASKNKSNNLEQQSTGQESAEEIAEEKAEFDIGDLAVQASEPTQVQKQLTAIETRFLESDIPLDDPGRQTMWSEMGVLNAKLQHRQDTTLCWSNALWSSGIGSDDRAAKKSYEQWLKCEVICSQFNSFTAEDLDPMLNEKTMRPLDSSLVASYVVWAAAQDAVPNGLEKRLNSVIQFIERQENSLPIRTVWLAWVALFELSGKDTLLLARARDRVLQRLFDNGMAAEYDMPNFMRVRGLGESDRFRVLREQVIDLHELISEWVIEPISGSAQPRTKQYANLMFSFALAKLGEVAEAKRVMTEAIGGLEAKDSIHFWLGSAFEYRISQALNGQSNQSQLSENLLERLEAMERMDRYKVDRFRGQSRMIEPHERINAFTRWHRRHPDELSKRLSELSDVKERDELQATLADLLSHTKSDGKNYGRVLASAIEMAPRLGEDFANHLFDEIVGWLRSNGPTMERANLLQKSMYVAAHFGRIDVVQTFISLFEQSLPQIVSEYLSLQSNHDPVNKEQVDAIESLFTESFRGLRKLGMREEIGRLYSGVADLVKVHEPKGKKSRQAKNSKTDIDVTRPLRLLLCVASGWYYFGQIEQAAEIVGQVREILLTKKDLPPVEQRDLACAYINCISHAPVESAMGMISELYQGKGKKRELANIKDNMTTSSHFSISQLHLIETTILALVSDEFSLNEESRRWLDEDEFLVRRRIHDDVRNAVK